MLKKYLILLILLTSANLFCVKSKLAARSKARADIQYCEAKKKEIDTQGSCDPSYQQYYDYFGIYKKLVDTFHSIAEASKNLNDTIKDCGQWLTLDADLTKMPATCSNRVKEIPNYVKDLTDNQKALIDALLQATNCLNDDETKVLKNLKTRKISLVDDYEVYDVFPLDPINNILTKMKNTLDYWLQKCKNEALKEQLDAQDTLQKRSMQMQLEQQQCDRDSAEYKADQKNYYKQHPACAAEDQYNQQQSQQTQQAKEQSIMGYANLALFGVMALPIFKEFPEAFKALKGGISKFTSYVKAKISGRSATELKNVLEGLKKTEGLSSVAVDELAKGLAELRDIGKATEQLKVISETLRTLKESDQIAAAGKIAEFTKGIKTEEQLFNELREIAGASEAAKIVEEAKLLKGIRV